ncbi:MAG TPA: radical SAM protein [Bryobacteraceae bacterium]|nr:radical SAM protein [Bryobacteraceae bacterium]
MKVLLIQPQSSNPLMDRVYLFEPLALEYVGAGLKQAGHEVRLVDARLEPDAERVFTEFRPEAVGITGFTTHLNIVKHLAARLKNRDPKVLIVVGGHHATVRPDDFAGTAVDVVVIGEGVFAMVELLQAVERGEEPLTVRGLALQGPTGLIYTEPRAPSPLDVLPMPDRNLTAAHRGSYFSEWFRPLASVRTSLGCTARCTFCALWSITGGKYLRRDPENVVRELQTIAEANVFFCDDESMVDVKRMSRLADLIAESGIRKRYFLYARVDTIVKHPELFGKWKRIGLSQVFVGMEDFSDARLVAMQKGISTEQQAMAVKILSDLGVMMYASFMVDPAYEVEDFRLLREYIRRLRLTYATFAVLTPLPGTELHGSVKNRLLSQKPELYDMLHALVPTRLPLPEFYEQMARLYAGAIPLFRSLPVLLRYGLHGILVRLRVYETFLARVRASHLDY